MAIFFDQNVVMDDSGLPSLSIGHTLNQVFYWASELTAQPDSEELTQKLLDILNDIPWVGQSDVYEIFKHERKKPGATAITSEYLIRKFPLDITRANEDANNNLLLLFDPERGDNFSPYNSAGLIEWALFIIKCTSCTERLIFVQGAFTYDNFELLASLKRVYQNLVILHDSRERDALTKLPNRLSLEKRLLEVCEQQNILKSANSGEATHSWIAVLDIDHFKRINDNFGHLYGDEVLLTFSQLIAKNFRYYDFIFRYGGEEFIVILNLINREHAIAAFNRFREAVSRHNFPVVNRVTVSIGVTRVDGVSLPTTIMDYADKALYHAKETGRNRVVLYDEMPGIKDNHQLNDVELF